MKEYQWTHTEAILTEYGNKVMEMYKDKLETNNRRATGDLIDSMKVLVQHEGDYIQVSLDLASYWKYVEWDTRPHFPPISAIRDWIEAKPVVPRADQNGKVPSVDQLAFLIARKISEVGTIGSHDLYDTIDELNDVYWGRIVDAVAADVTDEWNQMTEVWVEQFTDKHTRI